MEEALKEFWQDQTSISTNSPAVQLRLFLFEDMSCFELRQLHSSIGSKKDLNTITRSKAFCGKDFIFYPKSEDFG